MVNVAREMGIMVGPGRSSAAGSLLNYCLKITDVDPLEYGLLFERFYSGADELPKIDIDVEEGGREKLNAYLAQKYGDVLNSYGRTIKVTLYPNKGTTGVDNITTDVKATKVLRNGQLLIEKNGKIYNATGAEVK